MQQIHVTRSLNLEKPVASQKAGANFYASTEFFRFNAYHTHR